MPEAVDLHLRVRSDQDRRGNSILEYEMGSPSGRLPIHYLEGRSEPLGTGPERRRQLMLDKLQDLLRGKYTESQTWSWERIEEKFRNLGQNLYLRLLPTNIREVLDGQTRSGELSLLVESDETEIPWEVLHTGSPEGDFLCLRFSMGRWLTQPIAPKGHFDVARILAAEAGEITEPEVLGQTPPRLPRADA